ncbi:MAG: translocation/assembly module TamB domain-containing protein [Methylophilus sp.]
MLHRTLSMFLFSIALLLFTPVHGEVSLNADTSLDSFSYDLDNIHLQLEKLQASWQLSPSDDNKLSVSRLKAKRLVITMREDNSNSSQSLPDRINLPLSIKITQAEISEVIIKSSNETQVFNNVQFSFEGDKKILSLKLNQATTPWGEASASLSISTSKPFPLNGKTSLKQTSGNLPFDISAQISGNLNKLNFESTGLLALQENKLSIQQSNENIKQPIAHLFTKGSIDLGNHYSIISNIHITEMHTERLGNYPEALLNIDVDLNGMLQPKFAASVQFLVHDSTWQGQPLSSSGNLQFEDKQIQNTNLQAAINTNHLQMTGTIGKPDSKLEWLADLTNLNALDKEYTGEVHAKGSLEGTLDNLRLNFSLLAQNLKLPNDLTIAHLDGGASIEAGANGEVKGDFKFNQIKYGRHTLASGLARLIGTRKNHQITMAAQDQNVQFTSTLQGELTSDYAWQGILQQLSFSGSPTLKLTAPASLYLDGNGLLLKQANLELMQGSVYIDFLQINNHLFASKGHIDQFSLKNIPSDLLPDHFGGDVAFSGKWDINAGDHVNGNLSIWRESGDITLRSDNNTSQALGLTEAKLIATITDNNINLSANVDGKHFGKLNTQLTTALSKTDDGFALLTSAPLNLIATAQLDTLAWLTLFSTFEDMEIDGQISLTAKANGTLGSPNLSGSVTGKNLKLSLVSEGVNLNNGHFEAVFQDDALKINQASWVGGSGSLNTNGVLLLNKGKPRFDLAWTAEKFTVLSRTDRLLILSGSGKTTLADGLLSIFGDFTVNKGLIELAQEDTPVLSEDVIILGNTAPLEEPALQVLLNGLHINLGDDFTLRGRGLDTLITGGLTLTGLTQYHPHTEGSIQVKKGTYLAYGQTLNIERGILNFNGPMDNPGLNIRAMRNSKPVNAGIEITGSASEPFTKLVSDPEVAESEKLSWLVLGHGMATAGKNDYGMLSLAAGAILSQGQSIPLQTQIARAAGLDEFSFTGGDAESAALTFGKRLNSQLYLSYEKSISGLLDVARLTFNMTPRWSLIAEAGSESAVDVLYTFSFK